MDGTRAGMGARLDCAPWARVRREKSSMSSPSGQASRRSFLGLAVAAAAAWPLPAWARLAPDPAPAADFGRVFEHLDSAILVGRRYLGRYPDEAAPRTLATELLRAGGADPGSVRAALRARIRQDFERGDTVLLGGWVLARSECHACAAVALAEAGAAADRGR
jgi:hypothetical protein